MSANAAKPLSVGQLTIVALVASWTAGFVDTVGFLLLSDVLTANMSGNTVRIGVGAVTDNATEALRRGWPILLFVVGLVFSAIVHEAGARRRFLSTSAITFGLEAALLGGFEVLYTEHPGGLTRGSTFFVAAALLAFAMGLQNATVTRVGALSVKTTHVTGTLTTFAEQVSLFLFWAHDRLRASGAQRCRRVLRLVSHQESFQKALLTGLLWAGFAVGAISGAAARASMGAQLLLPPMLVLAALLVVDLARPIAASDEHNVRQQ